MKHINQIIEKHGDMYLILGLGLVAGIAITLLYCYDYIIVARALKEENDELRQCLGRPVREW